MIVYLSPYLSTCWSSIFLCFCHLLFYHLFVYLCLSILRILRRCFKYFTRLNSCFIRITLFYPQNLWFSIFSSKTLYTHKIIKDLRGFFCLCRLSLLMFFIFEHKIEKTSIFVNQFNNSDKAIASKTNSIFMKNKNIFQYKNNVWKE